MVSDLALQIFGVAVFLIPVFPGALRAALVPLAAHQFALRQDAGRGCAAHVPRRIDRPAALALALDGRHPVRRPAGPHRRRRADSLLQPRRRLSDLPGRHRRRALSFDGVLFRRASRSGRRRALPSSMPRWTALPTGARSVLASRRRRNWRRSAPLLPTPSRWSPRNWFHDAPAEEAPARNSAAGAALLLRCRKPARRREDRHRAHVRRRSAKPAAAPPQPPA